ncbi:MAG: Co2+/Mg2+ efflux protein ApaG [Acidiferrobacteraceae bacterium]|jgi:ApaG protein
MNIDPRYNVKVSVRSAYLDEQSDPQDNRYVFAYTVTIENDGEVPAKLLSRHWVITDSDNQIQEVRGEGVVGEQPRLSPGERFEYTSGTVIGTPVGTMSGSYRMVADDGTTFEAEIPRFTLSIPRTLH